MSLFLLLIHGSHDFAENPRFPLVTSLFIETKSKVCEIDDFAILSLARLPIPPSERMRGT